MNSDHEKYPKLITDEPVIADGLDSHYRIADAIRSLINKSDGGKTIGVEGAWGSGKSTVIKIFESKLSDKDGIQIYKFDAWTHQGEPLRRAFLEGLFENVIKSKWFQAGLTDPKIKKKWTAIKNELALKIKISTKTIVPEFDVSGVVLLLSFLCFPLGSSILTSAIAKGDASNFSLAIGGIVVSIPFVFVYCVFARIVLKNPLPSVRNTKIQEALGKLFQKGFVTDATKTIENIDPTTIEFQAKFSDFMQDALQPPGKKLVIVIDNLDRVSDKEVEAIWPILRSFVDNPEFCSFAR